MKTSTQIKFDIIVKKGFHEVLKPLGFKKKNNHFYRQLDGLGHCIYIQKSKWCTSANISFTINIGVFEPKFWLLYYDYDKKGVVPEFPTEIVCLIRKQIGELQKGKDIWYDIDENTDENRVVEIMKDNIQQYILPFLDSLNSVEKLLKGIREDEKLCSVPLGKLIFFAEYGEVEQAKSQYLKLLDRANPFFLSTLKRYAKKYNLN